ncbi:hypothetical protein [Haloarcula halophila]|uniref:hypothetical protein n=1 Tax=Haloarcula TaxID=2237 RepID=UPI0023E38971|nr:hypothetical protein [Halomicroarcula sp. DFY41]
MYSRDHALGSLALAVVLLLATTPPGHPAVLLAVVVGVGVGIDFDHFLVASLNTGSTKNLRRVLRSPKIVFLDQRAIFDPDDLSPLQRLLSHVVLAGLAVFGLVALGEHGWATVVGLTLYLHVLCDLIADVRNEAGTASS